MAQPPPTSSATGAPRGAPVSRRGADRSAFTRETATSETAYVRASKRNGSDRLRELSRQPGGEAAADVFRSQAAAWAHALVDAAHAGGTPEGDHRSVTEQSLRLTEEEARELTGEMGALLQQWVRRTRGRDASRRTYVLFSMLQPHPGTPGAPDGTGGAGEDQPAMP
ncbi:hypothetical protein [Nocardioides solisilvae]|uniref:hypothetical protein n=1 Tax=Nocardioides solisilvae TaxID=1542435 RepID=UPI000D7471A2|nr:hypothetical protein [Nocardioides solisilvae]